MSLNCKLAAGVPDSFQWAQNKLKTFIQAFHKVDTDTFVKAWSETHVKCTRDESLQFSYSILLYGMEEIWTCY